NLLHLLPDPPQVLRRSQALVGNNGTIVVTGPNFEFYKILIRRVMGLDDLGRLRDFDRSGIKGCGPSMVKRILERTGCHIETVQWFDSVGRNGASSRARFGRWIGESWSMVARRVSISSVGSFFQNSNLP